ncbi:MAG: CCA tRNA nucleotidyltransferase [Lachnospiraceae bacterium]|nr:CCA tRNA nucleotidyltransferase [Lachnospiraceae bacterium]
MKINLPEDVSRIIKTLTDAGFMAFAVGGCVRDSILGRVPSDWDITTSAKPMEIKSLFRRTIDTGIEHGTVTVMIKERSYEITTYRIDGNYSDGRHPDSVEFSTDLDEDLKRRDFTINAMAYNDEVGLVDNYGGIEDLDAHIIRAVGDPKERFKEDALRIMRAFRFAAQLGFDIEENTVRAASELKENLKKVSAERIHTELIKLITSDHPEFIENMYEAGVTAVFLPEFDECMKCEQNTPHHKYTVGHHTVVALQNLTRESCRTVDDNTFKNLRLTMLFHDFGKPSAKTTDEDTLADHFKGHPKISMDMCREIMKRLKLDNDTINEVALLVRWHDRRPELTDKSVRRSINRIGPDIYPLTFLVARADISAQSDYQIEEKRAYEKKLYEIYSEIIARNECVSLKDLAVNGKDLIDLGYKRGPEIGEILRSLLDMVLEDPACNKKEILLSRLEKTE